MVPTRTLQSARLDADQRQRLRWFLDDAFEGEFSDDDYEHTLGGLHVFVHEGGRLVGHGSVVTRTLFHRGRRLRTGYVEGVAVASDRRRRGIGAAVMTELERVIRESYELGALSATDEAVQFYRTRGWQLWAGPVSVASPGGVVPTPEDQGSVFVLPVTAELDLGAELSCDWRGGDVW